MGFQPFYCTVFGNGELCVSSLSPFVPPPQSFYPPFVDLTSKSKEKGRQFTPISFYQESCKKNHRVSRKKFIKEELADLK